MTSLTELRDVPGQCDRLPSLSAVALEILKVIRQEDASLRELAEILSTDPALATKVLRTVNSSFYGLAGKVRTVHHATVVLGMSAVKSVALSFTLVQAIRGMTPKRFDHRRFWTDCLTRAVAAKKLAGAVAPDLSEEAFVAAMLSHIGILAIHVVAPEEYETVLAQVQGGGVLLDCERKILGTTHAEYGAKLARGWHLPEVLALSILHHEDLTGLPLAEPRTANMVRLVYTADRIARFFAGPAEPAPLQEATGFVRDIWGMDSEQLDLLLKDIHEDVQAAAKFFEVRVEEQVSYGEILQMANVELARLLLSTSHTADGPDAARIAELGQERADLQRRAERLERLAFRDSLTGTFNLRACNDRLQELFSRAGAERTPLAVIFCDIDGFKRVNDTFGHDAANELLCDLTALMTAELRSADVLCRYGGDEFVVLLPRTDAAAAFSVAERLRRTVAEHEFQLPPGIAHVTLSVGVAVSSRPHSYPSAEALLQAADQAMYLSKRSGKNRVTTATEPAWASGRVP